MWLTLKQKHGLHVKRETVIRMLRELNPLGTLSRTRRRFVRCTYHSMGPNYVWHVDGYDKLKPFGIGISGCIDGFSRKIMWLKCGPTNKNPEVIKNNFIDCIRNVGVIPMRLRTDCGTENGLMESVQCTLRHDHRLLRWCQKPHVWVFYEQPADRVLVVNIQKTKFWMDLFADLRDHGHFNGTHEHQCLLRFCFMTVLQQTWLNVFTFGTGTESALQTCLLWVEFLMSCIHYLTDCGLDEASTHIFRGIRQKIHVIRTSMTISAGNATTWTSTSRYLASSIPAVDYTEGNSWAVNGTVPSLGSREP
ncbi:hypothetical protein F7725_012463 [Dissostichus mawsoni]|uniref:Integrase core domain-containing protein n=1 Tax=Dissostichus mawsoni TaxID=36200 RepID=A0A7J5YP02_DISMA|nr:hypothetical protein F7725_012463 [Dissostichus mawsoni]